MRVRIGPPAAHPALVCPECDRGRPMRDLELVSRLGSSAVVARACDECLMQLAGELAGAVFATVQLEQPTNLT